MNKLIKRASIIVLIIIMLAQGVVLFKVSNESDFEIACPHGAEAVTLLHKVEKGDSLWSLCKDLQKKYPYMREVSTKYLVDTSIKINPGLAPSFLREGEVVALPAWVKVGTGCHVSDLSGLVTYNH